MKRWRTYSIAGSIVLLVVSVCLGLMIGSTHISLGDIFAVLTGRDTTSTAYILITAIRLPRVLGGAVAGMGFAASGVILQSIMNNALASPGIIGVNSGAGFAAMLAMVILPGSMVALSIGAFVGALCTTLLIYALAYMADKSRMTIILAGIAVSSFLSAGINVFRYIDSDMSLNINSFLVGSLTGISMREISIPICIIIISCVIAYILARGLNVLSLGDDVARSLGLRVDFVRGIMLILASVLAGAAVSFAGLLGFVGLIVPHICRRLVGSDSKTLLPCSIFTGASMVVIADCLGRVCFAPYELPVGIIMSFIGAPFFLYLLLRKGGRRLSA